ncbi:UbiA family prenyltransferase [Ottowia thiooxydans]|uniref:UbiA family prenyltransferase n=1 Tax=Ottowia thiooxydans TaxID=219182 RepID=UPI00041403C5|nr:UbiA family prenyltransferase [Ottowia thiooxydans]
MTTTSRRPLVIDLDGTLVLTDTLHEQALALIKARPWHGLLLPVWLRHGKANLKQELAGRVVLDAGTLPYNTELLDWLRQEKAAGRTLVLCTAADQHTAQAIAQHLGIFDEVLASDGETNLSASRKADRLIQQFGPQGFDYAGNSQDDLPVWRAAHRAIVVNASASTLDTARQHGNVDKVVPALNPPMRHITKMMRMHQWLKNLLLFVPLLAAHQLTNAAAWGTVLLAFFSFSLCASAVYIGNDLLDLNSDRLHPRKRLRPFASGRVPVAWGVAIAPLLLIVSFGLAWAVGPSFLAWLVVYFLLTSWYSVSLKRLVLLDCMTLAGLYTLRILAGGAAADLQVSHWLLAVSGFLFLSLSLLKRHTELHTLIQRGETATTAAPGRGYVTQDIALVQALGIAAGYASAVVLALYLHGETVQALYAWPEAILASVSVLVYWISWLWLKSHRGEMHDDPLIFSVKDRTSLACGAAFVASLAMATVGSPW